MVAQEIISNIWISDYKIALDKEFLKRYNIGVVINCTKDLPFTNLEIKKYRLAVNDSLQEQDKIDMLNAFPEMLKVIELAYITLTPILIYCRVGVQRSPTLIAAFILKLTKCNFEEAVRFIQSKRDIAFRPSINFSKSLLDFKKTL